MRLRGLGARRRLTILGVVVSLVLGGGTGAAEAIATPSEGQGTDGLTYTCPVGSTAAASDLRGSTPYCLAAAPKAYVTPVDDTAPDAVTASASPPRPSTPLPPVPAGSAVSETDVLDPSAAESGSTEAAVSVLAPGNETIRTGWVTNASCGSPTPVVFVETIMNGTSSWDCWTSSLPLAASQPYPFAITLSPSEVAGWIYYDDAWVQLVGVARATGTNPMSSSASTQSGDSPYVYCAVGNCPDTGPSVELVLSAVMNLCGVSFAACKPVAEAYNAGDGLYHFVTGTNPIPPQVAGTLCNPYGETPTFGSNVVNFGGDVYCSQTIYSITTDTYSVQNGNTFGGAGTSCTNCYYLFQGLSPYVNLGDPANYDSEYQSESAMWEQDSPGSQVETGHDYSTMASPAG